MNSFRIFACCYCLGLCWRLHLDHRAFVDFGRLDLVSAPRRPGLARLLPIPFMSPRGLSGALRIWQVCLILLAFGIHPLWSGGLASCLSFLYLAQLRPHPWLRRKADHIPIVLALLSLSPGLADSWQQAWDPLWLLPFQLLAVQAYVSAGVQKLRRSGWGWMTGETLQAHLWEHWLMGGLPLGYELARRLWLCRLLSCLTMALELTFPLSLLHWKLALFYLAAGGCFHLAIGSIMGIFYLRYFGWLYCSYLPGILVGLYGK